MCGTYMITNPVPLHATRFTKVKKKVERQRDVSTARARRLAQKSDVDRTAFSNPNSHPCSQEVALGNGNRLHTLFPPPLEESM